MENRAIEAVSGNFVPNYRQATYLLILFWTNMTIYLF